MYSDARISSEMRFELERLEAYRILNGMHTVVHLSNNYMFTFDPLKWIQGYSFRLTHVFFSLFFLFFFFRTIFLTNSIHQCVLNAFNDYVKCRVSQFYE